MSHTVGCAFQVCLERKQKREHDSQITDQYTRFGSFRPVSLTERIIDPQSALIARLLRKERNFSNRFFYFNRTSSIDTLDSEN